MMASWSAWMVLSTSRMPGRAAASQAGDEGRLVVECGMPFQSFRPEDLVPVVADPTVGPAVPATARQPHRFRVGRREERLQPVFANRSAADGPCCR